MVFSKVQSDFTKMGGKLILTWALFIFIATAPAHSQYSSPSVPYDPPKEQVTNLHFFFHDTPSGKNPSAVMIAHANDTTPGAFGTMSVVDDPLTVGPEPTSEVIGNCRGIYVSASKDLTNLISYYDFGFTSGEFNGSSISVFSRNPIFEKERELAVVGGRGKFRMAKGFALLNTYYFNLTTGDAIVEYNVTVVHY